MEEIIKEIVEAEERALQIKSEAAAECAVIAENAEKRAGELARQTAEDCKNMREEHLKRARADAENKYSREIEEHSAAAKAYADKILKNADKFADEIVRRITGGGC